MRLVELVIAVSASACFVRESAPSPASPPSPPSAAAPAPFAQPPPHTIATPPPPPAAPAAAYRCPAAPDLDHVQATLGGGFGGNTYGGKPRFVVVVQDYATLRPIEGVPVDLHHNLGPCTRDAGCRPMHNHPPHLERMRGTTDAHGRVIFNVPDLEYQFSIPAPHGKRAYLDYSSIYNLGSKQCHELVMQAARVDRNTKYFVAHLVPASMLDVRTQDQAIAIASSLPEIKSWLPSNAQYQVSVKGGPPSSPTMWQVRWGDGQRLKRNVMVNAFDGSAGVNGRWN